jgi:hypothetical protein
VNRKGKVEKLKDKKNQVEVKVEPEENRQGA